jgi:hypothetical protein
MSCAAFSNLHNKSAHLGLEAHSGASFHRFIAKLTLALKKGLDKGYCINIKMPGIRYSYR